MANLDRAAAFAATNAGTTTIYFGTTPEDIRNRLAVLLPSDAAFDAKALTAVFTNGSKILFFPTTMRPEQSMALYCDNMYKDERHGFLSKDIQNTHFILPNPFEYDRRFMRIRLTAI